MGQSRHGPLVGAVAIDYRGSRYALGRTADAYGLWDGAEGGPPLRTFPLTGEGWAEAWGAYRALEGSAAKAQAMVWTPSPTASWARGQPLQMGPMRVGQILDGAFRLYRMHFGMLLALVALVILPFQALMLVLTLVTLHPVQLGAQVVEQPAIWVSILATAGQVLFVTPFLTAAVVKTASDAYLGLEPAVGSSYRAALPRVHSILWVTFLSGLAALACLVPGYGLVIAAAVESEEALAAVGGVLVLLGLVPAVFVFVRLQFGASVVLLEGTRGVTALRRSWRLVRGLTGKVLGTTILAGLVVLAFYLIMGAIFGVVAVALFREALEAGGSIAGFYAVTQIIGAVMTILVTPFFTLVVVLLYFDARIRKEGFDLALMAQQLGTTPTAGA